MKGCGDLVVLSYQRTLEVPSYFNSILQPSSNPEGRNLSIKTVAQEQLWIYLRIFVLMGVSWLSEAVHIEVHENHYHGCGAAAEVSINLRLMLKTRALKYVHK